MTSKNRAHLTALVLGGVAAALYYRFGVGPAALCAVIAFRLPQVMIDVDRAEEEKAVYRASRLQNDYC